MARYVGIFTIPVNVAIKYQIPLLVWGEIFRMNTVGPSAQKVIF